MLQKTKKKYLLVVVGPTAVGKTAVCIRLAKQLNTEVVSADSRQFFKELSIGTAKPTPEEMDGVPHHFVGHMSIHEEMNPGKFEQECLARLDSIFQKHNIAILTGGSGLYIKAVCDGMDEMPETGAEVREKINDAYQKNGLKWLQEKVQKADPDYYQQVDIHNPQRLIRALEVTEASGKPYSQFRKNKKVIRPFEVVKIGIERDRQTLYERINQRMDDMLTQGLLEEAQQFMDFRHINALQTVGYSEIYGFLEGRYDWDECIRLLKRNSRRYAKRQITWFKKDETVKWFEAVDIPAILAYVAEKLRSE